MKITEIQKLNSKRSWLQIRLPLLAFHPLNTVVIEGKAKSGECKKNRGEQKVPNAEMVLGL